MAQTAPDSFQLAFSHLQRVRASWDDPADWTIRLVLPSVDESRERARKAERPYNELRAVGDADAASELHLSMLTHLSRAALSSASVFPKSRPELASQLRNIDECELADRLVRALTERNSSAHTS